MKKRIGRTLTALAMTGVMLGLTGCSLLPVGSMFMKEMKGRSPEDTLEAVEEGDNAISFQAQGSGMVMYDEYYEAGAYEFEPEPDWNTEEYSYIAENGWNSTLASPLSTFAADVDTASYANLRRFLLREGTVPADAVRIEEMINYFHYDYPEPEDGEPFSVTTEIAPCPWNENTSLLLIGMKAKDVDTSSLPPSNLVFLIDVSGSMDYPDKLPLVQRAFLLLADQLGENDRISIVTYASSDEIVLEGVSGENKAMITEAVEDLMAGGGTNGSRGIETAYELAEQYFIEGGNNRVILATDGDLNLGITDEGSLVRLIEEKAKSGVYLSVLGFGTGNLSDSRMEALADHGNGNYSYIDSIAEARKVLIQEIGGTLFTVARDVKLQVDFNPALIKGYRLIGYENRTMAAEDFADDSKDGGEIGAGHMVTALYEIAEVDSAQEISNVHSRYQTEHLAEVFEVQETEEGIEAETDAAEKAPSETAEYLTVCVRYKEPDTGADAQSILLEYPVTTQHKREEMSDNMSWAAGVAQAGMILRGSEFAGTTDLTEVRGRLRAIPGTADDEYKEEFLYLMTRMD